MKKYFTLILTLLMPLLACAHDFEVDGIYYNIISSADLTVEVTYRGRSSSSYSDRYSGAVTIPATVTYDGNTYGVTSIRDGAFYNCISLTSITIPEGVTSIGNYAFSGCSSLTSITLPEGVTSIGNVAFSNCSSLTSITIPEGVTSIGEGAFRNCSSLTSITLPEGVTNIGRDAFFGCSNLTSINIPEGVTSIEDWAFRNCSSLTSITIPYGVTSIGGFAFSGCSSLTSITLPENSQLTSIEKEIFTGFSSLKELTLGKNIKKIEAGAFEDSKALEKITIYAAQPPSTDGYIFSDATYENATLYVPQGCVSKYQVMTGWSGFYNISEIEGSTPNYLTLRQADNGAVRIAVELGRTYQMQIVPSEGWIVHSVTFDGKDMTGQLTDDNTFTTPTLTGSAELNVAYVKESAAIESTRANALKVQGHQGVLRITGATEGDAIAVYTTSGTRVAHETAQAEDTEIMVPGGQVYLVTVADKVVKIGL